MKRPEPLTHQGRQTLIYVCFAWSGPVLTAIAIWILQETLERERLWPVFAEMARYIAWALLTVVIAFALFVSVRAIKIGPTGIEANSRDDQGER